MGGLLVLTHKFVGIHETHLIKKIFLHRPHCQSTSSMNFIALYRINAANSYGKVTSEEEISMEITILFKKTLISAFTPLFRNIKGPSAWQSPE